MQFWENVRVVVAIISAPSHFHLFVKLPICETVERGMSNDNTIKSPGQSTQYQSIILLEEV